jgi:hypothetical protein
MRFGLIEGGLDALSGLGEPGGLELKATPVMSGDLNLSETQNARA